MQARGFCELAFAALNLLLQCTCAIVLSITGVLRRHLDDQLLPDLHCSPLAFRPATLCHAMCAQEPLVAAVSNKWWQDGAVLLMFPALTGSR
jgi:hypothetical protein